MPLTVTTIGGTPYSIKFHVEGDGVDVNVIIGNAAILAAIGAQKSFLRDLLTAIYATVADAQNAITNTPEVDLRVDVESAGGVAVRSWGAEISIGKVGEVEIIVGTDVADANSGCYVKLIFEHTYVR